MVLAGEEKKKSTLSHVLKGEEWVYSNMKLIPQYNVIGPDNYDRIIHNMEKIILRDKI